MTEVLFDACKITLNLWGGFRSASFPGLVEWAPLPPGNGGS